MPGSAHPKAGIYEARSNRGPSLAEQRKGASLEAYDLRVRGALPDDLRTALESEGVLLMEEGVRGAISFRNFRAPGTYRSRAYRGLLRFALALTNSRIVVYGWRGKNVDVGWTDPALEGLEISADKRGRLVIKIDVHRFRSDWSGTMAIHLACEDPKATMGVIEDLRHRSRAS